MSTIFTVYALSYAVNTIGLERTPILWVGVLANIVALLAIAGIAFAVTTFMGSTTEVPDLTGKTQAEAEKELCQYAAENPEVFEGTDGASGWGQTDSVEYTMSNGTTVERADGGKLTDAEFLKSLPKKYIRAKLELNKAKIKADGLDGDALAELGLVRVATMSMKLKAKSSQAA